MKRLITLFLTAALLTVTPSCSKPQGATVSKHVEVIKDPHANADLTGKWIATWEDDDVYLEATITEDTILIIWNFPWKRYDALYWQGSFIPPTEPGDYEWTSTNNHKKTNNSLMGSRTETKDFAYSAKDDTISFDLTILEVTKKITMIRK